MRLRAAGRAVQEHHREDDDGEQHDVVHPGLEAEREPRGGGHVVSSQQPAQEHRVGRRE
jgi:hypothetical protein